ncbi:MAG: O-antigen ligase family protein [Roseburia sp.]|nr:O-antigen ligase family protein [Roseburia sp.]
MSRNPAVKKKETETIAASLHGFAKFLAHLILCLYLLSLFVIMPYYFTDGYYNIGTDKFNFFKRCSLDLGRAFLPVLLAYVSLTVILYFQRNRTKGFWAFRPAGIRAFCKANFSLTDGFVLLYGISLLGSYGCSRYREQARWGAPGWYMGLYTFLILTAVYFLISRLWLPRKWILTAALGASAGVFILGYLNRFGIFPLAMNGEDYHYSYISTIGNMNWFCGYLVCLLFFGLTLMWQGAGKGRLQQLLLMFYVWLGLGALIVQGSLSGYLALTAVFVVLYSLSAGYKERMLLFWRIVLLFSLAAVFTFALRKVFPGSINYTDGMLELMTGTAFPFLLLGISLLLSVLLGRNAQKAFWQRFVDVSAKLLPYGVLLLLVFFIGLLVFNTLQPGALACLPQELFTFQDDWGSKRGATWRAGFICFWEQDWLHKLVGVGPDSMYMHLYFSGNAELLERMQENFGTVFLTNAHCEWLTVLVNTGILGLMGFAGMIISAILRFIKARDSSPAACACGVSILAYTFNNIFSFQQIMSVAIVFALLGIGEAYLRDSREKGGSKTDKKILR